MRRIVLIRLATIMMSQAIASESRRMLSGMISLEANVASQRREAGGMPDHPCARRIQNLILLAINLLGIWRWLPSAKVTAA
ncbi:hypothetical protein C7G42_33380 [Bradyrhizobium sp. MOS003]|nr:hypothetical protein C7G42_33380 [Bradyrhizobium sp. MOS003]